MQSETLWHSVSPIRAESIQDWLDDLQPTRQVCQSISWSALQRKLPTTARCAASSSRACARSNAGHLPIWGNESLSSTIFARQCASWTSAPTWT